MADEPVRAPSTSAEAVRARRRRAAESEEQRRARLDAQQVRNRQARVWRGWAREDLAVAEDWDRAGAKWLSHSQDEERWAARECQPSRSYEDAYVCRTFARYCRGWVALCEVKAGVRPGTSTYGPQAWDFKRFDRVGLPWRARGPWRPVTAAWRRAGRRFQQAADGYDRAGDYHMPPRRQRLPGGAWLRTARQARLWVAEREERRRLAKLREEAPA